MSILDNFFGGGSIDFSGISETYDRSQQEIRDEIKRAEGVGRTDITSATDKSAEVMRPYTEAGDTSTSALMDSLTATGQQRLRQKFMESPGFQYSLNESQRAIERKAAATGERFSGAESRALAADAQGKAQGQWDNWLTNFQNRLTSLSGIGVQAAGHQSGIESQSGLSLAQLGYGYTGMTVNSIQAAAKAKAEAEMAEQAAKAKQSGGFLSSLGTIAGGAAGFLSGGGIPGAVAGAKAGSKLGGGY